MDQACVRNLGLLVADGHEFFSEEKRHTRHEGACLADGVPAYRLVDTCQQRHYRLEKEVLAGRQRDVLLQQVHFVPLTGLLAAYGLYVLLAPTWATEAAATQPGLGTTKGRRCSLHNAMTTRWP